MTSITPVPGLPGAGRPLPSIATWSSPGLHTGQIRSRVLGRPGADWRSPPWACGCTAGILSCWARPRLRPPGEPAVVQSRGPCGPPGGPGSQLLAWSSRSSAPRC